MKPAIISAIKAVTGSNHISEGSLTQDAYREYVFLGASGAIDAPTFIARGSVENCELFFEKNETYCGITDFTCLRPGSIQ